MYELKAGFSGKSPITPFPTVSVIESLENNYTFWQNASFSKIISLLSQDLISWITFHFCAY